MSFSLNEDKAKPLHAQEDSLPQGVAVKLVVVMAVFGLAVALWAPYASETATTVLNFVVKAFGLDGVFRSILRIVSFR